MLDLNLQISFPCSFQWVHKQSSSKIYADVQRRKISAKSNLHLSDYSATCKSCCHNKHFSKIWRIGEHSPQSHVQGQGERDKEPKKTTPSTWKMRWFYFHYSFGNSWNMKVMNPPPERNDFFNKRPQKTLKRRKWRVLNVSIVQAVWW